MDNLDTGNIRHTRHRMKTNINTNNTENEHVDTGNFRHTRHMMKRKINTTQRMTNQH